ncbi:MAG TPA: DUF6600 domain-containing protein, partial [Armatimonadota bacterium]
HYGSNGDSTESGGPVRLARFSYVQGDVTWRPSDMDSWSPATVNLPLRQDAQIWVTNAGRAEIQFDDGSYLRLGNGAIVTLKTLYSDSEGEFTQIDLRQGLSSLILKHETSVYQIDTPFVSVQSAGPSKVRVGVDDNVEIAVRSGKATVQGDSGEVDMYEGDYLDLARADAAYEISDLPSPDSWDRWNDDRDQRLEDAMSASHVPSNIALVCGDLDSYGDWRFDTSYGYVWCPSVSEAEWRPYWHGRWVWCDPFGWTWVGNEPWGWAPYHYGTWIHARYGWAWVPGPVWQYWCPAVVNYCEYNGRVAWVALAPGEVQYPSILSIGFRRVNWALNFSIGGTAVYYPYDSRECRPRPWRNEDVNRVTIVHRDYSRRIPNRNAYISNRFIPRNSGFAGVASADLQSFGGRGDYRAEARTAANIFIHGKGIGAPSQGASPIAGPIAPRVTAGAVTPSRTFLPARNPDKAVMRRTTYTPRVQIGEPSVTPGIGTVTGRSGQAARAAREKVYRAPDVGQPRIVTPPNQNVPSASRQQNVQPQGPKMNRQETNINVNPPPVVNPQSRYQQNRFESPVKPVTPGNSIPPAFQSGPTTPIPQQPLRPTAGQVVSPTYRYHEGTTPNVAPRSEWKQPQTAGQSDKAKPADDKQRDSKGDRHQDDKK